MSQEDLIKRLEWQISDANEAWQIVNQYQEEIKKLNFSKENLFKVIDILGKKNIQLETENNALKTAGNALYQVISSGSDSGWDNAMDLWESTLENFPDSNPTFVQLLLEDRDNWFKVADMLYLSVEGADQAYLNLLESYTAVNELQPTPILG